jgi:hypothetical protein
MQLAAGWGHLSCNRDAEATNGTAASSAHGRSLCVLRAACGCGSGVLLALTLRNSHTDGLTAFFFSELAAGAVAATVLAAAAISGMGRGGEGQRTRRAPRGQEAGSGGGRKGEEKRRCGEWS